MSSIVPRLPTPSPAATSALILAPDAVLRSLPLLAEGWNPGHRLPVEYRAAIALQLPKIEAACEPADARGIAVYAGMLADWIALFGLVPLPADESARAAALEPVLGGFIDDRDPNLPSDLLAESVRRIRRAWRYRSLPMPAEVMATVSGEWTRRLALRARLRVAERTATYEAEPDNTPAGRAKVRDLLAGVTAELRAEPLYLPSASIAAQAAAARAPTVKHVNIIPRPVRPDSPRDEIPGRGTRAGTPPNGNGPGIGTVSRDGSGPIDAAVPPATAARG